ncbi:LOW QUALITY PROTEIN: mRNA-decapping enzyme 1A [Pholidichthys leucotaenia]
MESANAGHMMSLAALQRQDPYINKLLDVTGQVALYNFNSKANEWEKTEIEGTLFVYSRSASPHHGFTIMNRLSTENLVEPINKDLEFQLQDPFLLYRNGNLGIYSIWFYDKKDCQRIAQLMVKIVKQEADHAMRKSPERTESGRTNGVTEPRCIDILELLSKAKQEYQRAQSGETDVPAESTVKATPSATERPHSNPQPEKQNAHPMVKQITVEELFSSSLPKESSLPSMPAQNTTVSSDPSAAYMQKQPSSSQQTPVLTSQHATKDPGSNHLHQVPGPPAPYTLHPSPVFQSVRPVSDSQPKSSASPLIGPPAGPEQCAPASYLGQELLGALKPAAPSVNSEIHKPMLAPSFLPSSLVPPHSFQEPMGKPLLQHGKEMDVFSRLPNMIKPMSAVPMSPGLAVPGLETSLLLSPSAFQQSINKTTGASSVVPAVSSDPSAASWRATEPLAAPCTKSQLQETLIHLIKNDPDFLNAIHEAYLQSVSKDFSTMKL